MIQIIIPPVYHKNVLFGIKRLEEIEENESSIILSSSVHILNISSYSPNSPNSPSNSSQNDLTF